jgi:pyruvate/2-oxoglutarate/acetoin dehydrogenase E1 component
MLDFKLTLVPQFYLTLGEFYKMNYKESICLSMEDLAKDDRVRFLGYNVKYGSKANGTLAGVNEFQLIETPVAENLMVGLAIGLSLKGFIPIVWFERFDFVLNALDAIVNHLDKMKTISSGEFDPKVIIRANVGNRERPLFTGPTHTQDFSDALENLVTFPVWKVKTPSEVIEAYNQAKLERGSVLITEYRDCYERF